MSRILPALAAVSGDGTHDFWNKLAAQARGHVTLLGAIGAVITGVLVWVVFIRERRSPEPRYHYPEPPGNGHAREGEGSHRLRRKWRRRRRDHRPRNPTLAETGGLPPIRSEQHPDHPA